jgi:hypothetical protein
LQQSRPSVQHGWAAVQQARFIVQHFKPFSQQPRRTSAVQQALFVVQQASFAVQQFCGLL